MRPRRPQKSPITPYIAWIAAFTIAVTTWILTLHAATPVL